jgi:non-specific serine/threonine protein kinase
VLRRDGDLWTIACGAEVAHLRDAKGLTYLAQLLRNPGQEFHALDLTGAGGLPAGDAGEVLDAEARAAYKRRVLELREELAEAEEFNDAGRQARLREEIETLTEELARAMGIGGRARKAGSDAERARLNVTRAIGAVVRKVAAECPVLGGHLQRAVRTGTFCSYEPESAAITWTL